MICHLLISYSWSAISWEISFAVLKHPRWWCWWTIKKVGSFSAPLSQISLKAEKNDKYQVQAVWKSCVVPGRLALALVSLILQALLSARAAPHHHRCSFKNTKNDYLMYRIWYQPKYQFFPGSNFGSVFNFASLFFALLKPWSCHRCIFFALPRHQRFQNCSSLPLPGRTETCCPWSVVGAILELLLWARALLGRPKVLLIKH